GGYNTRKALDIIESETRDLVHSGAPTRKSETDVEIAPLVQKMGATSIAEVEKMIGELASGKRFSGIRGGASSARGGALCHPHPDGVGLGKNHLRYRRRMARGGPPLTRPFEILPIRSLGIPSRGQQHFGAGVRSPSAAVPATVSSPDPREAIP